MRVLHHLAWLRLARNTGRPFLHYWSRSLPGRLRMERPRWVRSARSLASPSQWSNFCRIENIAIRQRFDTDWSPVYARKALVWTCESCTPSKRWTSSGGREALWPPSHRITRQGMCEYPPMLNCCRHRVRKEQVTAYLCVLNSHLQNWPVSSSQLVVL
jgi:hypothetical protein